MDIFLETRQSTTEATDDPTAELIRVQFRFEPIIPSLGHTASTERPENEKHCKQSWITFYDPLFSHHFHMIIRKIIAFL